MSFDHSPNMEKSIPPLIRSGSGNNNEDLGGSPQTKENSSITVRVLNNTASNNDSINENPSNLIPLKKNSSNQNFSEQKNDNQDSKKTEGFSFIPRLNLAIPQRQTQSMNLGRIDSTCNALGKPGMMIPGLNLQTLNLTNLPPNASKKENHQIVICLNYKSEQDNFNNNNDLTKNLSKYFGQKVKIENVDDCDIIESNENDDFDSTIPSIQAIDLAYQNLESYPFLIKQNTTEISHLTNFIDDTFTEISELTKLRERLKIENVLMKERINVAHQEIEKFKKYAVQTKKDYDLFAAKFRKK